MRNNFKQPGGRFASPNADTIAAKDAALRAALDYIEAQGGVCEWWKDELSYRIHRRIKRALEMSENSGDGNSNAGLVEGNSTT